MNNREKITMAILLIVMISCLLIAARGCKLLSQEIETNGLKSIVDEVWEGK